MDKAYIIVVFLAGWLILRLVLAARCGRAEQEHRNWKYCPRCGWARPADDALSENAPVRPSRNGVSDARPVAAGDACCQSLPPKQVLPSDLLRRRSCRVLAEDSNGNIAPSNDASAWSIYSAGFCAFPEGSDLSRAFFGHLRSILRERYGSGGVEPSLAAWCCEANRNSQEILGVSLEVERRMKSLLMPDGCDDTTLRAGRDTR